MVRPEPLVDQLIEASKDEYVTRHLVDGRIINCDQRISFIAGYMTEEVAGLSAFNFMHREDVRWVMIALRQSKSIFILKLSFICVCFSVRQRRKQGPVLLQATFKNRTVYLSEDVRISRNRRYWSCGKFCLHKYFSF